MNEGWDKVGHWDRDGSCRSQSGMRVGGGGQGRDIRWSGTEYKAVTDGI